MKRIVPPLFLLAATLVFGAQSVTAATEVPDLPIDVQRYLDRRASCDHWRGEDGYDADRAHEIRIGICKSCGGSDVGLDFLKKQHAHDPVVMEQLSGIDPSIEDKAMFGHGKMCSDVWPGALQTAAAAAPVSKVKSKEARKKSSVSVKVKAGVKAKGAASKGTPTAKAAPKSSTKPSTKASSKPVQKSPATPKAKTKRSA